MLNSSILIGHLGADPVLTYTNDGKCHCTFNLAFRCKSKDPETLKPKTGWIKITTFNKLAELCNNNLEKGSRIAVTGSLDYYSYIRAEDNVKVSHLSLVGHEVEFITRKKPIIPEVQTNEDSNQSST